MKLRSNNSFINVVITAFNEEKYLPRCLESLDKQTYPKDRFEVTVVDNNSTDKTLSIARKFGVKVILEKKQGYVYALKRGMDEAKGDIVAVTDADSQVASDWLWNIGRIFNNPDVVAVTGSVNMDAKLELVSKSMCKAYVILRHIGAFFGKPILSGFNLAVRREAFLKVGGINVLFTMGPDVDLGIRLSEIGKVKLVDDVRVVTSYRRWEDGFLRTLQDYTKAVIYAAWLRKPPPVKQAVIR